MKAGSCACTPRAEMLSEEKAGTMRENMRDGMAIF